jgi:hypothetical protein
MAHQLNDTISDPKFYARNGEEVSEQELKDELAMHVNENLLKNSQVLKPGFKHIDPVLARPKLVDMNNLSVFHALYSRHCGNPYHPEPGKPEEFVGR